MWCQALRGNSYAVGEMHRRLLNEQESRRIEIVILTDTNGTVILGASPDSEGVSFNPQNIISNYRRYFGGSGLAVGSVDVFCRL